MAAKTPSSLIKLSETSSASKHHHCSCKNLSTQHIIPKIIQFSSFSNIITIASSTKSSTQCQSSLSSSFIYSQQMTLCQFRSHSSHPSTLQRRFKFSARHCVTFCLLLFCLITKCSTDGVQLESCFGGIETFEKSAMYELESSVRPAGTLLQQEEQALTRDCISQCKQQPVCASFSLDYRKFHCAAYAEPSDRPLEQRSAGASFSRLNRSNSSNFFEKLCLRGLERAEYERLCGLERLWAVERVPDAFLESFEHRRITSVGSRADCARLCLLERSFTCRSADYDYTARICRLSREDRRSQPQAFRHQSGLGRDYLENQCASPGPTACLYDRQRDRSVASMDQLVFAEDSADCELKCDRERAFNCRAFSIFDKRCLLSADDALSLADAKPPLRPGHLYGERHCVSEHCSHGLFTYEKITGHVLRTANASPMQLPQQSSNVGITSDCRTQCDADPLNCPAFQVNYLSARCDRLDRNSQGRQLELIERDGENYFERVCLRVPQLLRSACRDKLWTFERILGYELSHSQYERVLEQVLSRRDCEEYCLQERAFHCRSALYDDESAVCKLSRHDRRSRASDFIRNNNFRVSYLENQCVGAARACPYQSTANAYPTYTDLVLNVSALQPSSDLIKMAEMIVTQHQHFGASTSLPLNQPVTVQQLQCEQRCNQSREFLCRSYAYYASTGECFLSGDDTISGYLSAISSRSAMLYQERKCSARNELITEPEEEETPSTLLPEDKTEGTSTSTGTAIQDEHRHYESGHEPNQNSHDQPTDTSRHLPSPGSTSGSGHYSTETTESHQRPSSSSLPHSPEKNRHGFVPAGGQERTPETDSHENIQPISQFPDSKRPTDPSSVHISSHVQPDQNHHEDGSTTPKSGTPSGSPSSFTNQPSFTDRPVGSIESPIQSSTESTGERDQQIRSPEHPGRKGWAGSGSTSSISSTASTGPVATSSAKQQSKKCTPGQKFTFDRVPNFEPIGGQMFFLYSDLKNAAIAIDCLTLCRMSSNCSGFVLDYVRHSCYGLYQEYSISKLDLRLTPGKDFFEGYCAEELASPCDRSWTFDRIVDQTVATNSLQHRLQLTLSSRTECARACTSERRFMCRSATFDLTGRVCRLYEQSRESGELSLQFVRGTEYLENQCAAYEHTQCQYNSIERDLTITSIAKMMAGHSTFYCEQLCNIEQQFVCRSYTYLDQTSITHGNLCLLSADSRYTSLAGSIKYRPRALYAEKQCRPSVSGPRRGREKQRPLAADGSTSLGSSGQSSGRSTSPNLGSQTTIIKSGGKPSSATMTPSMFDEPEVEGPPPERAPRICSGHQFTYEKVFGKQLRSARRDRITVQGNRLISTLASGRARRSLPNNPKQNITDAPVDQLLLISNLPPKKNKRDIQPLASAGLVADCQDECGRRGLACRSFLLEYSPSIGQEQCFLMDQASLETPEQLTDLSNSAYFEKICLREAHCNKLWTFERMFGYDLRTSARRIFQVNSRIDCQELCLAESGFTCRSAQFDYEQRQCRLYEINRRTRPDVFMRSNRRIDYLENQCVPEPSSCQFRDHVDRLFPLVDRLIPARTLIECRQLCEQERLFHCRSVTFDAYARQCSLSSEAQQTILASSSTNANSIVTIPPAMLITRPGTIYSERGSCERISVHCGSDQMTLQLSFDTPFHGRVYSKANPAQCSLSGDGQTQFRFPIPLDGAACGTRQEGSNSFVNEVVIQQHAVIMTEQDKTVKVLCSFEQMDQTLTLHRPMNRTNSNGIDVNSISGRSQENDQIHSVVTNTAAPPSIVMRILDRTEQDASLVSLGDPLILKIELPSRPHSPFGIQARQLFAKSSEQERLHLLDGDGCPVDPLVFPQMELDPSDNRSLRAPFKAFRFPSTGVVNFEVQIRFCPNKCQPVICGDSSHRRQSSSGGIPQQQTVQQQPLGYSRRKKRNTNDEFLDKNEKQLIDISMLINEFDEETPSVANFTANELIANLSSNSTINETLPYPQSLTAENQLTSDDNSPNPTSESLHQGSSYGLIYPLPSDPAPSAQILSSDSAYFTNEHWPAHFRPTQSVPMLNPLAVANYSSSGISFQSSWSPVMELQGQSKSQPSTVTSKPKKKFSAPRPLLRADGQPGTPKVMKVGTSGIEKEVPLSLAILVKNDKKKESTRSKEPEKRRKLISTKSNPHFHQMLSQTQCNSGQAGPAILYTAMVITFLYALIAVCGYAYYHRFVRKFTNARLSCAATGISIRPSSVISSPGNENFNMAAPAVAATGRHVNTNGATHIPSIFYGNLNETIRSLANSSISGYHQLYPGPEKANRSTKNNQSRPRTTPNHRDDKVRTTQQATARSKSSTRNGFKSVYETQPSIFGLPP